jgi:hypothetical protein
MMIRKLGPVGALAVAFGALVFGESSASAQVLGTFTWQMQPYCNKVTVTLTAVQAGYMLHGFDDQCGAGPRGSAAGTAVLNPDGSASVNFTIVTSGTVRAVQVSGIVSPASGQGTWTDSIGHTGTFALGGAVPGLPPRPLAATPLDVAESLLLPTDPCLVTPLPTMTLCGRSAGYWRNGGFGLPGLQAWRDEDGRVHLRGSVTRVNIASNGVVFVLPPELRPKRLLGSAVGTGANAGVHAAGVAVMAIYPADATYGPPGAVTFFSMSQPTDTVFHLGEIVFTVDR